VVVRLAKLIEHVFVHLAIFGLVLFEVRALQAKFTDHLVESIPHRFLIGLASLEHVKPREQAPKHVTE
jgi:hypothetical protein